MPTQLPRDVEVVFLDVGDTLIRADPSWVEVYASVFPEFGLDIDREAFAVALASSEWNLPEAFDASEEAAFQRIREFDGRVFAALGYDDLPEAFFRRVEEAFRKRTSWYVFPDVMPALDVLRDSGLRLAVISNWTWALPELLHDLQLASRFEAVFTSSRVGYQKPHTGIFRHALDAMGVRADRAVHVGDQVEADVRGAGRAGIAGVLIDRRVERPDTTSAVPGEVTVIHDLFGLVELLGLSAPAEAARR